MSNIPSELLDWFNEKQVKNLEVVENNPRKGRWCFSYLCFDNNRSFLKWNDGLPQHEQYKRQLDKEWQIYNILAGEGITPEIKQGGAFYEYQFLQGETLRKRLITLHEGNGKKDEVAVRLVRETLNKWINFIEVVKKTGVDLETASPSWEFSSRYLWALLLSSPVGEKLGKWEKYRNNILYVLLSRLFTKYIVKAINDQQITPSLVHGDFHANNVLVDSNEEIFLIDFEDARKGIPELELAFMLSMLSGLVNKQTWRAIMNELKEKNISCINKRLMLRVLSIYQFAVRCNHTLSQK